MGIAWVLFRELVDRCLLIGAGAILAGALLLSWRGGSGAFGWGALAIAGACVAWGFDNNLTRKLSSVDSVQIATVKGLVAGAVNVALALVHGTTLPASSSLAGAGLVGLFGYGVSLVLFVLALRYVGTARAAAYFSCAPFIGATLSVFMLQEPVTAQLIIAGVLMAAAAAPVAGAEHCRRWPCLPGRRPRAKCARGPAGSRAWVVFRTPPHALTAVIRLQVRPGRALRWASDRPHFAAFTLLL
jgi:drug/metabolite transporter (DMT)-like permease